MKRRLRQRLIVVLTLLMTMGMTRVDAGETPQQDQEVSFSLQLRDGSIVRIETADDTFEWKTVATDGTITESVLNISDIKTLKFTESPASDEVARIRSLVAELANDDYRQRHRAEATLLDEGKPFEKVIEQAREHREPEVRYRVHRILEHLGNKKEDNKTRFSIDFDEIELNDGRKLEGDIGDWALTGTWNGLPVSFDRKNSRVLMTELPFETWSEPFATTFSSTPLIDEFEFYDKVDLGDGKYAVGDAKDGYRQAAFDKGARGERMMNDRNFDVSKLFTHQGVAMKCETHNGIVVISGYRFKKSQSKNRSIGNFFVEPEKKKKTSYQGVMRIDFCIPGNERIPATVNLAAVFTEIVIPHHTIVQAYNASGHVIGLTESAAEKMSFLGMNSNEPIAYLKVSANSYLDVEKLNRDFAIDDLTFSPPVAAPDLNFSDDGSGHIVVITRDHQRLLARSVSFDKAGKQLEVNSATESMQDFKLPLDQVVWITPPQSLDTSPPADGGVYVMLKDGSVVHCQIEQKLVASFNPDVEIDPDMVIGVWSSGKECRYPQKSDFDEGKIVMVQPLHRIVFEKVEFDWNNGGIDYDLAKGKRLLQAVKADGVEYLTEKAEPIHVGVPKGVADPGRLEMANSEVSIWTAEPSTRATGTGLLRTNDGQEFVLGGESGFELASVDGNQIVIKFENQEMTFDMADVHALNLPK